jgi:hypothetical protein
LLLFPSKLLGCSSKYFTHSSAAAIVSVCTIFCVSCSNCLTSSISKGAGSLSSSSFARLASWLYR